jgi:hypothetical protein
MWCRLERRLLWKMTHHRDSCAESMRNENVMSKQKMTRKDLLDLAVEPV